MDIRIVLCVVVAVVAVEARLPFGIQCAIFCPYGFVPGSQCVCKEGTEPSVLPCDVKRCEPGERCVVRGIRTVCVPRRPSRVCYLPKKVGPCEALIPRFFYNRRTWRCERFIFGGCEANFNNFETIEECKRTCPRPTRY